MEELLGRFTNITGNPYQRLAQWKEQTKGRVIGCLPMYVPEEIIHAAGILPVTILASDEEITLADRYVHANLCSSVRAKFDMSLKGELGFLDGIIFADVCDFTQQIPDIWQLHSSIPFQYSLELPEGMLGSPSRKSYLGQMFTNFKASLEKFSGQEITDERLRQSIAIYNRNRTLLSRLYELRRSNPSLFHARDMVTIVAASMLMPKEEHSELLTNLLACVEGATQVTNSKPKLLVSGNLCDWPAKGLMELIDEVGAVVVDDDLYTGSRYFVSQVDETLKPIEALAEQYISGLPCPTKSNPDIDWADYLLGLVKRAGAEAVIILKMGFCEKHGYDYPYLKQRLSQAGIPHLLVETGHRVALGQIRTRLQAFTEILKGV